MKRAHPFDVVLVVLVVIAVLPVGVSGQAAAWTATIVIAALVMRQRWRPHAIRLSRATMRRVEPVRRPRDAP